MATETGENRYKKYGQPSLDLQFSGPKGSLKNRSDGGAVEVEFSRTQDTQSTYVGSDGLIKTAATNEARFDHDPVTGESLGLLIEESRTNYSPGVYNFVKSGSTAKEVYGYTLPDGTVGRLKYHAYITSSSYEIYQSVNPVGGVGLNHVHSYYVKNISGYTVSFRYGVSNTQTATIPDDGKWHRLIADNYVANGLNSIFNMYMCSSGGSATDPSVSGPMELLFWGENIEAGSFVTSYIPTPATFTSRASEATFYDENGIVSIASTDVARDDAYFPDENGNFISAGLLLEEERTNYVTNNTAIQLVQSNCTVGLSTGLDNNNTATTATCSSDGNFTVNANPNRGTTWPSATDTTWSFYVKSNSITEYRLDLVAGAGQGGITFTGITTTPTFENIATKITDYGVIPSGNGWYRLWAVYDDTLPNTSGMAMRVTANGGITGDTFQVWGEQCEIGTNVTSVILTSGGISTRAADISSSSTSTRGADVASITNNNIYNTEAFTILNKPFGTSGGSDVLSFVGPNIKRTTVYSTNLSQTNILNFKKKTDEFWRWRILGGSFGLPSFTTDGQVTVDWGDGTVETLTTSNHTFTDGGGYHEIGFRLDSGTYFRPFINDNASHDTKVVAVGPAPESMKLDGSRTFDGCSNLESFDATVDATGGTSFESAWRNCSSLTSFPLIDTSSGIFFASTWSNCTSLTSFPLIDTSSGNNFGNAWDNCNSLTSFPLIDTSSGTSFGFTWRNCTSLTSFPLIDTSSGTSFSRSWDGCNSLTSFPLIDTAAGTNFVEAWRSCSSLTSFPAINTSSGTNFTSAWQSCSGLISFPLINMSSGTNFNRAWYGCSSLTSFPAINTSSGTNFNSAWQDCTGLTSFSPIDVSNGTHFDQTWRRCTSLVSFPQINVIDGVIFSSAWFGCTNLVNFPPNVFDNWTGTPATNCFNSTWGQCPNLSATSVENILNSIDTSGRSAPASGVGITIDYNASSGTPSISTAVTNLKSRGWTITLNGVAQ